MQIESTLASSLGRLILSAALGFFGTFFIALVGGDAAERVGNPSSAILAIYDLSPGLLIFGYMMTCLVMGEVQILFGKIFMHTAFKSLQRHKLLAELAKKKSDILNAEFSSFSERFQFSCGIIGLAPLLLTTGIHRSFSSNFENFQLDLFTYSVSIGGLGVAAAYWELSEISKTISLTK